MSAFLSLPSFWFFKLLLLGAMCSGAFFIPDQETFLKGTHGVFWATQLLCFDTFHKTLQKHGLVSLLF